MNILIICGLIALAIFLVYSFLGYMARRQSRKTLDDYLSTVHRSDKQAVDYVATPHQTPKRRKRRDDEDEFLTPQEMMAYGLFSADLDEDNNPYVSTSDTFSDNVPDFLADQKSDTDFGGGKFGGGGASGSWDENVSNKSANEGHDVYMSPPAYVAPTSTNDYEPPISSSMGYTHTTGSSSDYGYDNSHTSHTYSHSDSSHSSSHSSGYDSGSSSSSSGCSSSSSSCGSSCGGGGGD
jgi:hypothetical protein